jgi:hypothetical protein
MNTATLWYVSWNLGHAITQVISPQLLTSAAQVHAQVSPVRFVVDKFALVQVFLQVLRFSPHQQHYTKAPYALTHHMRDGQHDNG